LARLFLPALLLLATGLHLLVLRRWIIWWWLVVVVVLVAWLAVVEQADFSLAQDLLLCQGLRMLFLLELVGLVLLPLV
jgi:hypothetical protein